MAFELPVYRGPDFESLGLNNAPDARLGEVVQAGVAPKGFHSTSMFPEYVKLEGSWVLAAESRMDSSLVVDEKGQLKVIENRNLRVGDRVVLGRSEDGHEGIYVHTHPFTNPDDDDEQDSFVFRQGRSRETAYSRDYDRLMDLLRHEREHGNVVWVMGPAFAFDYDARRAFEALINAGFVDGLLAGNALATHDLEGAYLHTALGQDIYTQKSQYLGHYNHLDVLNEVRRAGSIANFISENKLDEGIMCALERNHIPYVLASSIRDDGPLPEVIENAYEAQDAMRGLIKDATTVICMATMLHTIAAGNMSPSFRVDGSGTIRPLYLYAVDMDEFVVNKLLDRGSLSATTIVANVQDFIFLLAKGLSLID